jgi:hypothetical protein
MLPSLAFSYILKALKSLQNYDKLQETSVFKFSTEQNNVTKITEYLEHDKH